jgi:hypothetical protein
MMTDALLDRIKAHRSAPDVYDPPTFDQMADRILELEDKLAIAGEAIVNDTLIRRNRMSLASKCQQYDVLVKELFELLDTVEESDDGREFKPTLIGSIRSCRSHHATKLNQILTQLKSTLEDKE